MTPAEIRARKRKAWEMFRNGASDSDVSTEVGVTRQTAAGWRLAIGIKRPSSKANPFESNEYVPTEAQIADSAREIKLRNIGRKIRDGGNIGIKEAQTPLVYGESNGQRKANPNSLSQRALRYVAENPMASRARIAQAVGCSSTVAERAQLAYFSRSRSVVGRCPDCGGRVLLPCLACETRRTMASV